VCPVCGGKFKVIGSRKRMLIDGSGAVITLIIRRLRCKKCRGIHHELPDIIVPYKRHCAGTIEKIIAGDTADVNCETSTMRRLRAWWESCRLYFESILASLRAKYGALFSGWPSPKQIVRAVANANLWVHTRPAFLSG
jgi:hypothetical protein